MCLVPGDADAHAKEAKPLQTRARGVKVGDEVGEWGGGGEGWLCGKMVESGQGSAWLKGITPPPPSFGHKVML